MLCLLHVTFHSICAYAGLYHLKLTSNHNKKQSKTIG